MHHCLQSALFFLSLACISRRAKPRRRRVGIGEALGLWLAVAPAKAQTWELIERLQAEQYGSSILSSDTAPNGDIVVGGAISGTTRFGPAGAVSAGGHADGYVARRSAQTGQWLWAAGLFSPPSSGATQVLALPDNDVLVLGSFSGSVRFGAGISLSGEGTYDGYIGRLNGTTGTWRWVAQLATRGGNTHIRPTSMALRASGELVVVGTFSGQAQLGSLPLLVSNRPGGFGTSNFDLFVARLDLTTGRWLQSFGAGGQGTDEASDVAVLPNGDIAIAGTLQAPLTLGSLPPVGGAAARRAFVARLDPVAATWRWVQQAQASTYAEGQRLTRLPTGDLAVSGKYAGTAQLGALTLVPGLDQANSFVARLRADDGQWQWATAGGGTGRPMGPGGLDALPNGDVVIINTFSGRGRFGALPVVSSVSQDPDIFVGQLNGSTGQWQWLSVAGGTGGTNPYTFAGDDFAGDIHALSNQQVRVTGAFGDVAYLGPGIGPLATRLNDGFIARITVPAPCPDTLSAVAPAGLRVAADSADCAAGRTLRVRRALPGSGFAWSTGSTDATIRVTEPGRYTVRVSTLAGCRYLLSYDLTPADVAPREPIPNIITPNADGRNDYWQVAGLPAGTRLQLFNRWGQRVYQTASYANDWDAKDLPAGTYYYLLEHPQLCPAPRLKGWVEVVR